MTYYEYYNALNDAIIICKESNLEQYKSLKGTKDFLNADDVRVYRETTNYLRILILKSDELLSLFRNADVNFNDEVDPDRLTSVIVN